MNETNYPNYKRSDQSTSSIPSATEADTDTMTDKLPISRTYSQGGFGELNGNAVDIQSAYDEYEHVRRTLTERSNAAATKTDIEKGEQVFDLTEYLANQHAQLTEAGLKAKNMGLVWKHLTVKGLGADARSILTNGSVLLKMLQFWKWGKQSGSQVTILHDIDGFSKSGEMLLVLGRPGSGTSTMLRVLANMRASYTSIDGDVSYGGIDAKEFGKYFKGEVCYNEEEDLHYPTLTTEQTLRFALKNKTPSTRLPGESKSDFIENLLYMLGNMLGLTKQMKTMVGDAFVRGLSGGERKRLSIAEQMTTHSSINCWDGSTRGLDASSALDYVRSLRIMTDIMHKTTVATLYQASDSIFQLFDKVMVLDEGRCIYFGPIATAKDYFIEMGFHCPERKSTPDFLTGLCNLNEREVHPGFEARVPLNAAQFEKVYKESGLYAQMMQERDAYEAEINLDEPHVSFREAFQQAHNTPFVINYYQQVKALTVRQLQLIWGDKTSLLIRYIDVIAKGLITASIFYMMPLTVEGLFSRAGAYIFIVFFNAVVAQAELPAFMESSRVLEKHKHFAMYRPSAFYVAQVIADIPLSVLQAILFELCCYFIMGFVLDAGRFFSFFINLVAITMCMNSFFRFWGAVCPNFYTASQISSIIFTAFIIYVGYQLPYPYMHPWLMWIYWINPLAYSFKALIGTELTGARFSCAGINAVPFGPSYTEQAYRSCILPGAEPGASFVLGDSYLAQYYAFYTSQNWINFLAVVLLFVFFSILAALAMEFIDLKKGSTITKVYKKGFTPKVTTAEKQLDQTASHVNQELEAVDDGTLFTWHHVNYSVPIKGGKLKLLNNVNGFVKPGSLTALMGSSGAGKTTLLDVLSRRKTIGTIEGNIYMNGEHLADDFERLTGYCEQMDVHNPNATVREALQFSAYLRQPAEVPKQEKDAYVEQILDLLEMQNIGDALVGDLEQGTGISVEERKRLTIAVELVGKPKLLFLDEPTSGLDAQSSYNIVRFIRKLADAGWPVLCTIHQPSATLFEHFDHLLLLVRGGQTAYFGEIGKDSRTMIDYFESNGGPGCAPEANPAEYILECVGAGTAGKASKDWAQVWSDSPEAAALEKELETTHSTIDHTVTRQVETYALPFWQQFSLVFGRMNRSWWRSPSYNLGRALTVCLIGFVTGFTFWKVGSSPVDLQNRMFGLLTSLFMGNSMIILIQPRFIQERAWFRREYASKYYGSFPFALSCILVEIPYLIAVSALFMFFYYWTTGLQNESDRVGYFFIIFVVYLFHSVSLGYVIAAFCESPSLAAIVNPFFITVLLLFNGIFQPPGSMPAFWSSWMYWLNPYHYLVEGLVTNGLDAVEVVCEDKDYIKINTPPGSTCGEYMSQYFADGGLGYLGNPNSTDLCDYCQYSTGNDYYEYRIGWSFSNRWRNFGLLWLFTLFNVAVFFVFVYVFRKQKR
ncbi:unnamed protein product [Mucor fragilis]